MLSNSNTSCLLLRTNLYLYLNLPFYLVTRTTTTRRTMPLFSHQTENKMLDKYFEDEIATAFSVIFFRQQ